MMRVRVTVGGQRTTTDCVRLLDVCSPPPPLVHAREGHGVSSGFASRANGPPFPRRHGRWSRLVPAHHPPTPHRFFPGTTAQPQLGWGLSHRAPAALPTAHCSGTASGWTQVEWLSPGRHPGFFACCCRNRSRDASTVGRWCARHTRLCVGPALWRALSSWRPQEWAGRAVHTRPWRVAARRWPRALGCVLFIRAWGSASAAAVALTRTAAVHGGLTVQLVGAGRRVSGHGAPS